jgi:hypothetical protein
MQSGISVTQRAFQLARSGSVSALDDIKRALHLEGYTHRVAISNSRLLALVSTPAFAPRCPCCGGRMIVIETFEGARPGRPPSSRRIRIDTS